MSLTFEINIVTSFSYKLSISAAILRKYVYLLRYNLQSENFANDCQNVQKIILYNLENNIYFQRIYLMCAYFLITFR